MRVFIKEGGFLWNEALLQWRDILQTHVGTELAGNMQHTGLKSRYFWTNHLS